MSIFYGTLNKLTKNRIKVLLFDLDGTLIDTSMLEPFRSFKHPLFGTPGYTKAIEDYLSKYNSSISKDKMVYFNEWCMGEYKQIVPFIGVITKSPKAYAKTVLKWAYPKFNFDILIAHEDVTEQKPKPKCIALAVNSFYSKFNVPNEEKDPNEVLYIGNENTDIETAYNAGIMSGIKLEEHQNISELHLNLLPEFEIHNFADLKNVLLCSDELLPIMERDDEELSNRVSRTPFRYEIKSDENKERYEILVSGRYFPKDTPFGIKRKYHKLSKDILDNKNTLDYSDKWFETLRILLTNETESSLVEENYSIVITCIPKRQGQQDRLERLLFSLSQYLAVHPVNTDCQIHICPDLLAYTENAVSNHKEAKTRKMRFKNVEDNLFVKRPELLKNINKVIVIDDVVTSGASLIGATKKIYGVAPNLLVVRFAFAQTFSELKHL